MKLNYRYDGDLLIPLQKGDYVVYYPNEHNNEIPVRSGDKLTIGMIFYHLDELDLSDYDLMVHFHRGFTQGWSFIAFMVTVGLWVIASVMHGTSVYLFRNERKQMELRRSGLSYMSELYEAIYVINLPTGEVAPVSPGKYIEELREKYTGAKELLYNAVVNDADKQYLDAALAFVDSDTMAERLKGRKSMAVADVYDALVSKRVYKEPMSFEQAARIMCEGMGTQFDPNMRIVFQCCRPELERYCSEIQ